MRKLISIIATVILTAGVFAQAPQRMSYQAVIRNSSDQLIKSSPVGMRISILQGSSSGTVVYTETQTPTTNANGLVSIEIGGGSGFDAINWGNYTFFIKTETDPTGGTGYTITGISQILSVPYAIHAKTVASYNETDPVFIAHPANGITGANITNWNSAYGWGNPAGQYRPISYVPAWSEITSNPFSFASLANNQLLKYNTTNSKFENWTPNYLTSFTETDPIFVAWNKSTGINITASQVSDFTTSVTNNAAMVANTAKNSYPTADATKLAGIASGANVGLVPNTTITSGTNTKITYDAKGLVTAGNAATTADIAASTNKNYVTDVQLTVIGNTSGINTGDNAVNNLYSGLVSNATHTGDATGSSVLTLATVNSNVGTFNNITINAKGLATAGSNVTYLTTESDPLVKAINGIIKSNGTTISAAVAGDFPILNQNTTGNAATATIANSSVSFTGSLVGDVTGTQGATVVSTVGTSTAANVHSAELLANAATNANIANTIVKRDESGNFTAGTITAALNGNASTATTATTATTAGTVTTAAQPAITSVGTLTDLTVSGTTTVATPVHATDAANKAYVDAIISQIKNSSAAGGVVTDNDNNEYNTVKIGTQVWMSENLKTTKYNDGTAIPWIWDNNAWSALTTGAYSDYDNTRSNSTTYGRLYNWYTVDNNAGTKVASNGGKNVCPTGWHVPSDAEWTTLTDYLTNNGYGYQGSGSDIAKSMASTFGWTAVSTEGRVGNDQLSNNSSGFTALPSGFRYDDGTYFLIGDHAFWWSSTENSATNAYHRYMYNDDTNVYRYSTNNVSGFSVRCLRDF